MQPDQRRQGRAVGGEVVARAIVAERVRHVGGAETRQLKLYFTYHFGNSQVKAARQRKSGLEEESKRAGASSGGFSNNK